MSTLLRFSQLSSPRQALVRLFESVNFGQILAVTIQDGDPVFDPKSIVLLDVKLDADEGERHELELSDFALRDEVRRLMRRLDELKNGRIERIEVRHGVPWRLTVERGLTEAQR
jgi:hypothetical protein